MYNSKLVAIVKVDGKVLREMGDTVYLPFGSEYSIQVKNLHNTKALISIEVDGTDVLDGKQLIIEPNKTSELEGFMRGQKVTNKFRFIEKTQEISDFRGDEIEDGLVKISYQFEVDQAKYWYDITKSMLRGNNYGGNERGINISHSPQSHDPSQVFYKSSGDAPPTDPSYSTAGTRGMDTVVSASMDFMEEPSINYSKSVTNESGITARGSESSQTFRTGHVGVLEMQVHSMVIMLKGETADNRSVKKPVMVHRKVQCENCGRKWKSSHKFCGNCSTSLI